MMKLRHDAHSGDSPLDQADPPPTPSWVKGWALAMVALALSLVVWACVEQGRQDDPAPVAECLDDSFCAVGMVCSVEGRCMERERWLSAFIDIDSSADPLGWFLWQRYGTRGARGDKAISADGHGFCGLSDVRTDDIRFRYTSSYPGGYWGGGPIDDIGPARCGDDLETLSWRLLNCERITQSIPPLACDLRLVWIGRQHASDMAQRNFFGHVNPDGVDPFRRLEARGVDFGAAGENLARQHSVLDAHLAWMDSSLHRRNILTETFDFVGIGVVRYGHQLLLSEAFVGGLNSPEDELDFIPESRPVFPMERSLPQLDEGRRTTPSLERSPLSVLNEDDAPDAADADESAALDEAGVPLEGDGEGEGATLLDGAVGVVEGTESLLEGEALDGLPGLDVLPPHERSN